MASVGITRAARRSVVWLVALVAVWFYPALGWSQLAEPKVSIEPKPSWVVDELPAATEPEASGGVALLFADQQISYRGGKITRYMAAALKLTSSAGASELGEREFEWSPPHERLVIHSLTVERNGVVTSHLRPERIEVLRREQRSETGVYDGARTALIVIPDVRVGDTLRYAYSIVGQNPVLAGHFSQMVLQGNGRAMGWARSRIASDRPLALKPFAGAQQLSATLEAEGSLYEWSRRDIGATRFEEESPEDFDPVPWVQVTDFDSWGQVASWGTELFRVPEGSVKELDDWQRDIEKQTSDETERALLALRRVQDEIRYLSLSFAESTHRPAQPAAVLARRYGDCKDKSLLTVTLLRRLGIDAHVALVESSGGAALEQRLPSTAMFDHAIVVANLAGRERWLDPTRSNQRGGIDAIETKAHRAALILDSKTKALTVLPAEPRPEANIRSKLEYVVGTWGGPVSLQMDTSFRYTIAEAVRTLRTSQSADEVERTLAKTVLDVHKDATLERTLIDDDESENVVRVRQSFLIDARAWQKTEQGTTFLVSPPWMRGLLPEAALDRKSPLALTYPYKVVHSITVETPEPVTLASPGVDLNNPWWHFSSDWSVGGKRVSLIYNYEGKDDRVEGHSLAGYRDDRVALLEASFFELSTPSSGKTAIIERPWGSPEPSRLLAFGLVGLWAVGMVALFIWLQRKQPWLARPSVPYDPTLVGRGGWLSLIAIGVTLAPLRLLYDVSRSTKVYEEEAWNSLVSPGSPAYQAAWGPILILELAMNVSLFCLACWVGYLFWTKGRSFPVAYIASVAFSVLILIVDDVAVTLVLGLPYEADRKQMTQLSFQVLWCIYMLQSRRVRSTFLPHIEEDAPSLRSDRNDDGDGGAGGEGGGGGGAAPRRRRRRHRRPQEEQQAPDAPLPSV